MNRRIKKEQRQVRWHYALQGIETLLFLLSFTLSACSDDSNSASDPDELIEALVCVSPSVEFEQQTVRVTKDVIYTKNMDIPVKDAVCKKNLSAFVCCYTDTFDHVSCRLVGPSKFFHIIPCATEPTQVIIPDFSTLRGDNWMHFIADTTKISNMSIAGTHDSDTYGAVLSEGWAQTQELNLRQQFNLGVRLFDIRPSIDLWLAKWFTYDDYCQLYNYHGVIRFDKIRTIFDTFQKLMWENPDEAIFVILNYEGSLDSSLSIPFSGSSISERAGYEYQLGVEGSYLAMNQLCQKCFTEQSAGDFDPDLMYGYANIFRPGMTMSDCRGKITFIFRDQISPDTRKYFSGSMRAAANCPTMMFSDGENVSPDNSDLKYYVQDKDHLEKNPDDFFKKDSMAVMALRYKQAHPDAYIFNFLSGYYGSHGIDNNVPIVAEYMNAFGTDIMQNLASHCEVPSNFVIMDFAGVEKQYNNANFYDTNGTAACRLLWLRNFYRSDELIEKAKSNTPIAL